MPLAVFCSPRFSPSRWSAGHAIPFLRLTHRHAVRGAAPARNPGQRLASQEVVTLVATLAACAERASGLEELARRILRGRRLIVASNRGPTEFRQDEHGLIEGRRGSGGVVTALAALGRYVKVSWIASAMTEGDRLVAAGGEVNGAPQLVDGGDLRLRFVVSPPSEYDLHYNVFSNPILWFVQHRLTHMLPPHDLSGILNHAWQRGYQPVNQAFARAIAAEAGGHDPAPVVMLHDYHLYLAAEYLRERLPRALIQQFVHIPWPEPNVWAELPNTIVRGLCRGMLANDIIGFQTRRCVTGFLRTCEWALPDAQVDHRVQAVGWKGRWTMVNSYPISLDVESLRRLAASDEVAKYTERLRRLCGEHTIVKVDRLDPSKNVIAGFDACDRLLYRQPELRGKVKFLAFLVPSRTSIPQYKAYADRVFQTIDRVNATHGCVGWRPIELFYENNYAQAIAAMRLHDVLMVNSSLDGMNLVSKEAPIVNERDAVLVLSRGAGSFEELGQHSLGILPFDVEGTATALATALAMPREERRKRAIALKRTVDENDIVAWLQAQLGDMLAVAQALPAQTPLASVAPTLPHIA